ncbi:MAG: T9SS type A sorting domain-containing protein, partial [Bacteroidetes bacterium]|nr:T9SS type A sorting domain-containing protein [Bacteroidota bacterium]
LRFGFDNINLPDSTTDEPNSHGFVSFTVSPVDGITPGTSLENFADIYFDYNSAIRTDTAIVTALDTTISSAKSITVTEISTPTNISEDELLDISIYPNPTSDYIFVSGSINEFNQIRIYDLTGKHVINQTLSSADQPKVNVSFLAAGIYFIHLVNANGDSYSFKMVKE